METESTLPHSQVPATCPYPEPNRSSPCPHIPFPEDPSEYYLGIYVWVSQVVSFSKVSPPKTLLFNSTLPHTCYMSRPSHSSRFDHPNNIGWAVQIIKLLIMQFSTFPCYLFPLRPKCSSQYNNNRLVPATLFTFKSPCCEKTETPILSLYESCCCQQNSLRRVMVFFMQLTLAHQFQFCGPLLR